MELPLKDVDTVQEDSFINVFGSTTLVNHGTGLSDSSRVASGDDDLLFSGVLGERDLASLNGLDVSDVEVSQKFDDLEGLSVFAWYGVDSENLIPEFHDIFISPGHSVDHVL